MINIYNLIKSVKEGKLSFNSFNLRIKKADSDITMTPEEQRREQENIIQREQSQGIELPKGKVDPAAEWLAQQEQGDAVQRSIQGVSIEQEKAILNWIENNRYEMENQSRESEMIAGPLDLSDKLEESPYFLADKNLYDIIGNDGTLNKIVAQAIIDNTDINKLDHANIFVDTMLAKSSILAQLDTREYVDKAEKAEDALQPKITKGDDYSVAQPLTDQIGNVLPDPHLELEFMKKYRDPVLHAQEKEKLQDAIGGMSFDRLTDQPETSAEYMLGSPEGGAVKDQRMNFFLKNLEHLQGVMDENLQAVLNEQLPDMGLGVHQTGDISNDMGVVSRGEAGPGSQGRLLNILHNTKGAELLDILKNLITESHPDVYEWVGSNIFSKREGPEVQESQIIDSNKDLGATLEDRGVAKQEPKSIYEDYQVSEILGDIGNEYLKPTLKKSKEIMQGVVNRMSSHYVDDFKDAISIDMSQMKKKDLPALQKRINTAKNTYYMSEIFRSFSLPIIEHMDYMFSQKSKKSTRPGEKIDVGENENLLSILYKSSDGKIHIPDGLKDDLYDPIERPSDKNRKYYDRLKKEEAMGLKPPAPDDIEGIVGRYMNRMKNGSAKPFVPDWSKMINYRYPAKMLKEMGELKDKIKTTAAEQGIKPGSYGDDLGGVLAHYVRPLDEGVSTEQGNKPSTLDQSSTLDQFAGVVNSKVDKGRVIKKGDSEAEKAKKRNDFVYMTLLQPDEQVRWLQTLGSQKGKQHAARGEGSFHNLKSIIGGQSYKMFGHMANKKEEVESAATQSLIERASNDIGFRPTSEDLQLMQKDIKEYDISTRVILGLLDHHSSLRNFLDDGNKINAIDNKGRTNTELYYDLRGVDPPGYIKNMIDIDKTRREVLNIEKSQGQLKDSYWFNNFQKKFEEFDPIIRAEESIKERLDKANDQLNGVNAMYSDKVRHILNNPKEKIPDIQFNKRIRNIERLYGPEKAAEIDNKVREWDANYTGIPLSSKVYTLLGYKSYADSLAKFTQLKKNIENGYESPKTKKFVDGKKQVDAKVINVKNDLREMIETNRDMLISHNQDPDRLLKGLGLLKEAYTVAIRKIMALENMKNNSMKFASAGYTDYIDSRINRAKMKFDYYFNSLFS
jgi:hypothetical protein